VDPRGNFMRNMQTLFPNGLQGRSVLDCGCNCGGILFWAKDMGAGRCFGFDARERWIEQARFVAANRTGPGADIEFEVCELYDLPELGLEKFDITVFNGVLYHLPEPVGAMQVVADLTKELMVVSTQVITGYPDGCLVAGREPVENLMYGVHGLRWLPTGPETVTAMLNGVGFVETRCNWWHRRPPQRLHQRSRLEMLAARDPRTFEHYDATRADGFENILESARATIPRGSTVAVVNKGDWQLLKLGRRCGWHFPQDEKGGWAGHYPADSAEAIAHLEELRAEGADYLLVPDTAFWWLDHYDEFARHLESRYSKFGGVEQSCVIFSLGDGAQPS